MIIKGIFYANVTANGTTSLDQSIHSPNKNKSLTENAKQQLSNQNAAPFPEFLKGLENIVASLDRVKNEVLVLITRFSNHEQQLKKLESLANISTTPTR